VVFNTILALEVCGGVVFNVILSLEVCGGVVFNAILAVLFRNVFFKVFHGFGGF
jgi:hypothetical protein